MRGTDEGDRDPDLRPWYVYTLHDPRLPAEIRYVGWTTNPKVRLWSHIGTARTGRDLTYCGNWKRMLLTAGLRPILTIVETGVGDGWKAAETKWIAHYREMGSKLTNLTDGGDGTRGYRLPLEQRLKPKHTTESKKKIGDAHRGRKHTPETRANMRAAQLGKKHTPEHTAKITAALTGRKQPPEERARRCGRKMSPESVAKTAAANTGKKRTEECRDRMRASHLGVPLSPEHAKHVADAHRGLVTPQETKTKISTALKEHYAKNGTRHIKHSEEAKAKMSAAKRARDALKKAALTAPVDKPEEGGGGEPDGGV